MTDMPADLAIKGLSFWAIGRSYPQASDAWDADMIDCRIVVQAPGARIELDGRVGSRDVHWFLESVRTVHETLTGEATLDGSDTGFWATVTAAPLGQMSFFVAVTPSARQKHEFTFEGDQTELLPIVAQCRAILERFPVLIKLPD